MKVSENTTEVPSVPTADWPVPNQPVAPWWHTAIFIVVIIGISVLTGLQSKSTSFGNSHIRRYVLSIAWECFLALLAWWGLRIRRTPVREILGVQRRGWKQFALDFGVALLFWIIAIVVLGAIATVLRFFHLIHPQKAVIAIAPQTLRETLVWIALCCTAGVSEEFVFRGYFLQQFASLHVSSTARSSIWIAVVASSLLFGAGHGYEGVGGMVAITAYGAMFCALAILRRSLRAGMIAHAWHDSITGIALAIAKHSHLL
jgi:uncharacterized protein